MKTETWEGIYVGDEFPEHYGSKIKVWDDHSNPNNPRYTILLNGEEIDNMDDGDIQFL